MINSVLRGDREPIFDMDVHEEILYHWPSVGMVELFYHLSLSSYVKYLSSFCKLAPFALEQILQGSIVVPDSFMEDIFVINIGGCGTPCELVIHSN